MANYSKEELQYIASQVQPYLLELVKSNGLDVDNIEVVEDTDGITSLPAYDNRGGTKKVVRVPLSTFAKPAQDAADSLANSINKADEAAANANAAANRADASVTEINSIKGDIEQAVADAQKAVNDAQSALLSVNEKIDEINASENERELSEQQREDAEAARTSEFNTLKGEMQASISEVVAAIDNANDTASHPTYVGEDNYVYIWNKEAQSYDKTDIYVKGDAFNIKKVWSSVSEMNADTSTYKEGDFGLVNTNDVEDPENAQLYVYRGGMWSFLVDMSGAIGFTGKTPQFFIGNVTKGDEPLATLTENGTDLEGNPVYLLNLVLPKGDKGEDGQEPVIEMGSVTTLDPSESASAELLENGYTDDGNPKYILNLSIPRGQKGENGEGSGNVLVSTSGLVSGKTYLFKPNQDESAEGTFVEYEIPEIDTSKLATKNELEQGLSGKQDTIEDLETIRKGAEKGNTALQEHQDISHLATNESVNEKITEINQSIDDKLEEYATKEEIITVTDGDGTKYLANDGEYKEVDALPQGGTVGQVLTKTDEGAEWMDSTGGEANLAAVDTDEEEIDDVDTLTFVKYTPQTLTDEQKAQAKENLGITMDDFDLSDYATNESVDQKIAAIEIPEVDLSGYAKSEDIPTKVSELENDANYISDAIYSNGVYIQDINGKLWTEEKWDGSVTPNGIAVIAGVCRFVIALNDTFTSGKRWGGNNILIEGIYTAATASMASKDYNGKEQTDIIISSLEGVYDGYVTGAPALKSCKDFVFPDGSSGYMGAAGEWDIAMSYNESIDSALLKCSGSSPLNRVYYTSTQRDDLSIWCVHWGGKYYMSRSKAVIDLSGRAFTELKVKSAKERIEELENTKQDKIQIIDHGTDDTMFELTPNILHKWGTVSSLTLTLATPEDDSVANYYMIEFTSGTTATSLSLPDTITWANDLNIEAGKTYQISILNNLGVIGGF